MIVDFKKDVFPGGMAGVSSAPAYSSLFDDMPEVTLRRGERLYSGKSAGIYLVTKGMIKLYSLYNEKEMLEDYFHKGELVNCGVILGNPQDDLIAEALTSSTAVRKIPAHIFEEAVKHNAFLFRAVLTNLSDSLRRVRDRLRRLTLLNSKHRVIHFLADYVEQTGRRVGYEYVVKPVLTHQEMAWMAGTARQTVSTVLNELRNDRIIHFNRQYLIVRDLEALWGLSPIN